MKRKRALKMLMGAGMSRNAASRFIREPFAVGNDAKVFVGLYRMAVNALFCSGNSAIAINTHNSFLSVSKMP